MLFLKGSQSLLATHLALLEAISANQSCTWDAWGAAGVPQVCCPARPGGLCPAGGGAASPRPLCSALCCALSCSLHSTRPRPLQHPRLVSITHLANPDERTRNAGRGSGTQGGAPGCTFLLQINGLLSAWPLSRRPGMVSTGHGST